MSKILFFFPMDVLLRTSCCSHHIDSWRKEAIDIFWFYIWDVLYINGCYEAILLQCLVSVREQHNDITPFKIVQLYYYIGAFVQFYYYTHSVIEMHHYAKYFHYEIRLLFWCIFYTLVILLHWCTSAAILLYWCNDRDASI